MVDNVIISVVVFAGLSATFASYGVLELTRAYKATTFQDWSLHGLSGGGGVLLAAVFVVLILQMLG